MHGRLDVREKENEDECKTSFDLYQSRYYRWCEWGKKVWGNDGGGAFSRLWFGGVRDK
ncbi:hypothetical protein LguiA_029231 [Lonicera macranthoides]